jgi:broad-specificity NMP kinase
MHIPIHDLILRVTRTMSTPQRTLPNILIAGTPATGKTTLCTSLVSLANPSTPPIQLKHLSINDIIKSDDAFHSGSTKDTNAEDASLEVSDDNLDALMDHISSPSLLDDGAKGGYLLDWHSCSGFAVRWIDLVVVLRCEDTTVLYDRLSGRGYGEEKVQENLDAEIFGVIGEEAKESWEEGQVVELKSEQVEEIEENAERILQWINQWISERTTNGQPAG